MTNEQRLAHERLLAALPVRQHVEIQDIKRPGGRKHTAEQVAALKRRIKALRGKGWTVNKIARHLKLSAQTIYNHSRERKDY